MINSLLRLKKLTGINTKFMGLEKELRLKYLLDKFNFFDYFDNTDPNLRLHTLMMVNHVKSLFQDYTYDLKIKDRQNMLIETQLAALFHDIGKIKYFKIGSKYDTLNTEFILRKYELNGIAQAVRKNPFLLLSDLRNGLLTIPQLIVAYSDLLISYNGAILSLETRIKEIIKKKKNINREVLKAYANIIERLYKNRVIRTPHSKPKVAFFERLDGRYPIVDDEAHLGKVSSYHIAKELESMGYQATIFSDYGSNFKHSGVEFFGMGNDLLEAYSAAKKFDYVYITGWTSLFIKLRKNPNVLPLIVLRSLKKESLTKKRLKIPKKYPTRTILVSKESLEHINSITKEKLTNVRIIENGIDSVFYYNQDVIKDQFIFVGAFIYEKGAPEILEIAREFPQLNCIILGSGTMYGKEDYSKDLPSNVRVLGEVDQTTVSQYFRSSLFSLSMIPEDRLFETFGKSVAESQVCGCPVIGIINGGLKSTILNNNLNTRLEKFDLKKIKQTIINKQRDYRDPFLREILSNIATNRFNSWRITATHYLIAANEELIDILSTKINSSEKIKSYLYS